MPLEVNEIFYSIQGESSFTGWPCVFVRLTGCNLRCTYCDTQYAYTKGNKTELEDIVSQVENYRCELVLITGGEPLVQKDTPLLVEQLLYRGLRVLIETNGSIDIGNTDARAVRIMDIKCPSSGEADKNCLENLTRLQVHDEVKFVMGDREDYEFAKNILAEYKLLSHKRNIHFAPISGQSFTYCSG